MAYYRANNNNILRTNGDSWWILFYSDESWSLMDYHVCHSNPEMRDLIEISIEEVELIRSYRE